MEQTLTFKYKNKQIQFFYFDSEKELCIDSVDASGNNTCHYLDVTQVQELIKHLQSRLNDVGVECQKNKQVSDEVIKALALEIEPMCELTFMGLVHMIENRLQPKR